MITYRVGNKDDQRLIADLHSKSWIDSYRGFVSDFYLDHEVEEDRKEVWQKRFESGDPNLLVLIAEEGDQACGFAGTYLNHDPQWGALLDNLHVLKTHQGLGIGAQLLIRSAHWVHSKNPDSPLYLWVYTENNKARDFYERLGASYADSGVVDNPGGGRAPIIRCVWNDLQSLICAKAII